MSRIGGGTPTFGGQCPVPSVGAVNTFVSLLVESLLQAESEIARPDYFPPDYGMTALNNGLPAFDYVVIGAGTAGSVVASRLSEDPEVNVLVLEEGEDPPMESEIPSLYQSMQQSSYMFNYYIEPNNRFSQGLLANRSYWPTGRVIGGTGSTNALHYFTGSAADYDKWMEMGNIEWGFNDVWPYFEKSIRIEGNATHPQGYVQTSDPENSDDFIRRLILKAGKEMGEPTPKKFSYNQMLGYSNAKATIRSGHRSSSGKGHLTTVSERTNLKIIKNAQVTKLIIDLANQRVMSVEFLLQKSIQMSVNVRREAILSAGTIGSPKLLMLSGIGPQSTLNSLNITDIVNLPVGENLQDHVTALVFVRYDGCAKDPKRILDTIYKYLIHNKGAWSTLPLGGLNGFIKTCPDNHTNYPDIQFQYMAFNKGDVEAMRTFVRAKILNDMLRAYMSEAVQQSSVLAVSVRLLHPKSRGSVKLASDSIDDPPIIEANYFAADEDLEVLTKGLEYLSRFVATSSFQSKNAAILKLPLPDCESHIFMSDSYWQCYIQHMSMSGNSPAGTVKMGLTSDPSSVVNTRLKVKGIQNLRVVDASIMPLIPSVELVGPTLMIAEKAADMIREDSHSVPLSELSSKERRLRFSG